MNRKKAGILALVSLTLGVLISVWSYYFINYAYGHESGYGPLPANCKEYDDRVECIGLTDYETSGFPIQFSTANYSYKFQNNQYDENTTITIDTDFSWPLFMVNSLIWSVPAFASLVLLNSISSKKKRV